MDSQSRPVRPGLARKRVSDVCRGGGGLDEATHLGVQSVMAAIAGDIRSNGWPIFSSTVDCISLIRAWWSRGESNP